MKYFHFFVVIILLMFCLASCTVQRFTEQRLALSLNLSIPVSMIIYARSAPDWNAIYDTLNGYAHIFDYRVESNTLWQLNHNHEAQLDEDVFGVLKTAVRIAELSHGAFDPTILPLVELWNIEDDQIQDTGGHWQPPADADVQAARAKVDYRRIVFMTGNIVSLPADSGIDLGGIAKGAIVDKLADYLNTLGYQSFLIEAGGDILVSGLKPAASPPAGSKNRGTQWSVAIRHPRRTGEFITTVTIGAEERRIAIVTSGDYERYVEVHGRRYHHLLGPATGYPAAENTSVTVMTATCSEADALATAAFVLGFKEGTALLERQAGVEGMVVREREGRLEASLTTGFPVRAADLNLN